MLIEKEDYLMDMIQSFEVMEKFVTECDSVADQTFKMAKTNT